MPNFSCQVCAVSFATKKGLSAHRNFLRCQRTSQYPFNNSNLAADQAFGGMLDIEPQTKQKHSFPLLQNDELSIAKDADMSIASQASSALSCSRSVYDNADENRVEIADLQSIIDNHESNNHVNLNPESVCSLPSFVSNADSSTAESSNSQSKTRHSDAASYPNPHKILHHRGNDLYRSDDLFTRTEGTYSINVTRCPRGETKPTSVEFAWLTLINLLDSHRCPRNLGDKIFKWIKICRFGGLCFNSTQFPLRKRFTNNLIKKMHPHKVIPLKPQSITINLQQTFKLKKGTPNFSNVLSRLTTQVHVWDFAQQVQSLLQEESVFGTMDNVVSNPIHPFLPIPNEMEHIIGSWYVRTVAEKKVTGTDGRFMLGCLTCLDKTWKTQNGTLTLEPLLLSFVHIKPSVLYNPRAWRMLALLPNLESHSKAIRKRLGTRVDTVSASQINYNSCLEAVFNHIRKTQSGNVASSILTEPEMEKERTSLQQEQQDIPTIARVGDNDIDFSLC